MLDASRWYQLVTDLGFEFFAGVPCSYLGALIPTLQHHAGKKCVITANEGDAVAMASGSQLAGTKSIVFMQNSGLGNAVSPLTSLTHTFAIPCLLMISWRGEIAEQDEPQHELMGEITPNLLNLMKIKWSVMPTDEASMLQCLREANDYMQSQQKPYAFIVKKGTFAKTKREKALPLIYKARKENIADLPPLPATLSKQAVLSNVVAKCQEDDWLIVSSTGYISRELFALADRKNQFYMVGSMGCASALAMGLAICQPSRKILILDGDGAALMRMGNLATIGTLGPANLYHVLIDNGMHESTGGQPTVAPNVHFADIAKACGYGCWQTANQAEQLDQFLNTQSDGSHFLHFCIRPGVSANLPRPNVSPKQVKQRFCQHIEQLHHEENTTDLIKERSHEAV